MIPTLQELPILNKKVNLQQDMKQELMVVKIRQIGGQILLV